jgi:hypothetical protein
MKTANKTLTVESGGESWSIQVTSSLDGLQSAPVKPRTHAIDASFGAGFSMLLVNLLSHLPNILIRQRASSLKCFMPLSHRHLVFVSDLQSSPCMSIQAVNSPSMRLARFTTKSYEEPNSSRNLQDVVREKKISLFPST